MTREDARAVQRTHRLVPGGKCTCRKPYPCDDLTAALNILTGQAKAT